MTQKFAIATGFGIHCKQWHNKKVTWEEFVEMCAEPAKSGETIKEFLALKPREKSTRKDTRGFVAGDLNGGKRTKWSILGRSMIVLDADKARPGLWDFFSTQFNCTALYYTTRSHTPQEPRLRFVIPLSREVSAQEYTPISRRVCEALGIEQFDRTTHQADRLMFFPTVCKDGEYLSGTQDGPLLDADEILSTYRDFNDASTWPRAESEHMHILEQIAERKKVQDPLEKKGIVGIFCRTYTISDVIEAYLQEVYEPTDENDRFDFITGSLGKGLQTFEDDKFAWSYHNTDPAGDTLCNAFDLVRIHYFGDKDAYVKEGTPANKYPSYIAMENMANEDAEVRKTRSTEKLAELGDDYKGLLNEVGVEEVDPAWYSKLSTDKKGTILPTYDNVESIMRYDPKLRKKFGLNEFSHLTEVKENGLPWMRPENNPLWSDLDDAGLRRYLGGKAYEIKNEKIIKDCRIGIAFENRFHGIRDYLNSLEWDGIHRLDTMFVDYVGAEDTPLNRIMTRKSMVAAVARVFEPGKKFDHVLTLISTEGAQKSTLLNNLGRHKWFLDTFSFSMLSGGNGVRALEQIQNKWIVEIPEMSGLKKVEIEAVKSFITSKEDYYRASHQEHMTTRKRQCVFFGTSNNHDFLTGTSGNRRFWPMPVMVNAPTKMVEEFMPDEEVSGLWAEAVMRYLEGETLFLNKEMEALAKDLQTQHTDTDPREEQISWYLDFLLPESWEAMGVLERRSFIKGGEKGTVLRTKVSPTEIWIELFEGSHKEMTNFTTRFIKDYMQRKAKGWKPFKSTTSFGYYGPQRGFFRETESPGQTYNKTGFSSELYVNQN